MKLYQFEINDGDNVGFGDMIAENKQEAEEKINKMIQKEGKDFYFFDVKEVDEVDDYHVIISEKEVYVPKEDEEKLYFIAYFDAYEKYFFSDYLTAKNEEEVKVRLFKEKGLVEERISQLFCNSVKNIGNYQIVLFKKEAV